MQKLLDGIRPDPVPYSALSSEFEIYDQAISVPAGIQLRGWIALLMSDAANAAGAGRQLAAFVARQNETSRNRFLLRQLSAEAALFLGQRDAARRFAHESLDAMPRKADALGWMGIAMNAARIFAWADDPDEADTLLEALSVSVPGLPPADIARDPLYTVPLSQDSRFQVLRQRLDAQLASSPLEKRPLTDPGVHGSPPG